jgi:hypothetical protein
VTVLPGVAGTVAVFAAVGNPTLVVSAANIPALAVTTPIRNGALVCPPAVTVTLTDGTPAGISNGVWTFN